MGMSSSYLLISIPKPNRQVEAGEKAFQRAQRQYALGKHGFGPRVFVITKSGVYITEPTPYPSLLKAGVDIKKVERELTDKMMELGIESYDDKLDNFSYDSKTGKFHILDAGSVRLPANMSDTLKPTTTQDGINEFLKKHAKLEGQGEARSVYRVPKEILTFFKKYLKKT